ncbi:MAG TPA: rhomboid family intramembrane serine protease [Thermoanaerobaculia bacterium]|nr:rhomboid family intramembrane serine protease [Thermoanaerobaculia bacterium]
MLRMLRRAPLTATLLVAIGLAFAAELALGLGAGIGLGGPTDRGVLLALGANVWPLEATGAWRLVASLFLHIGVFHLLVNAWALLQLGGLFEAWMGPRRLALVYFVGGVCGSLASVFFTLADTDRLSAGASGAIFAVLGALIAFLVRRHERLRPEAKSLLLQLLFWAGLNVYLGFTMPAIDNGGHLGGFAAGLVIGLFIRERRRLEPSA